MRRYLHTTDGQVIETIDEDLHMTGRRGAQSIKIPPITVDIPSPTCYVINSESAEIQHLLVSTGLTKVLRHIDLFVTSEDEIASALMMKLEEDASGRIAKLLGPCFPDQKVTYLANPSLRPTEIGVKFKAGRNHFLFSFHIGRGAISSKLLPGELAQTILVTSG